LASRLGWPEQARYERWSHARLAWVSEGLIASHANRCHAADDQLGGRISVAGRSRSLPFNNLTNHNCSVQMVRSYVAVIPPGKPRAHQRSRNLPDNFRQHGVNYMRDVLMLLFSTVRFPMNLSATADAGIRVNDKDAT